MPSEFSQASIYLVGAQVGRDNAQPTWQKELEDSVRGSTDFLPEGKRSRRLAWTTGEDPDQGK